LLSIGYSGFWLVCKQAHAYDPVSALNRLDLAVTFNIQCPTRNTQCPRAAVAALRCFISSVGYSLLSIGYSGFWLVCKQAHAYDPVSALNRLDSAVTFNIQCPTRNTQYPTAAVALLRCFISSVGYSLLSIGYSGFWLVCQLAHAHDLVSALNRLDLAVSFNIQYPTRNIQCPRKEVAALRCFYFFG